MILDASCAKVSTKNTTEAECKCTIYQNATQTLAGLCTMYTVNTCTEAKNIVYHAFFTFHLKLDRFKLALVRDFFCAIDYNLLL